MAWPAPRAATTSPRQPRFDQAIRVARFQSSRRRRGSTVTVTNGTQAWWAVTRGGQTYAAPANGIHFSDTARLNPLAAADSNIASVLNSVRQRGCGGAELAAEQSLVG